MRVGQVSQRSSTTRYFAASAAQEVEFGSRSTNETLACVSPALVQGCQISGFKCAVCFRASLELAESMRGQRRLQASSDCVMRNAMPSRCVLWPSSRDVLPHWPVTFSFHLISVIGIELFHFTLHPRKSPPPLFPAQAIFSICASVLWATTSPALISQIPATFALVTFSFPRLLLSDLIPSPSPELCLLTPLRVDLNSVP